MNNEIREAIDKTLEYVLDEDMVRLSREFLQEEFDHTMTKEEEKYIDDKIKLMREHI